MNRLRRGPTAAMVTPGHMRVLKPTESVWAFYHGRVDGYRYAEHSNWVDDGALTLRIASYAVVDGDEALVYDTHVSIDHAAYMRSVLERSGVSRFTVLLSHWYLDHVAGTPVFADHEIVAGVNSGRPRVNDAWAVGA